MLTPNRYFRVPTTLVQMETHPLSQRFVLPDHLAALRTPPTRGDGLLLADYAASERMGLVRYLGIISGGAGTEVDVNWRAVDAAIWVDSSAGIGNWNKRGGFCFAASKVAGYGLHHLYAENFEGLDARETLPEGYQTPRRREARRGLVSTEKLIPMEIVGEATSAPRGGWVYVLKSALGYKVGRTRSVPRRMLDFGVKLPILYSIPFVVWFEDHVSAETSYHRHFANKHINGEWFDLSDSDLDMIRSRRFL